MRIRLSTKLLPKKDHPFRALQTRIEYFKRKNGALYPSKDFDYKDVIQKFGENPICYLTGEKINYIYGNYHLDHIVPPHRGGTNELENLQLLNPLVNLFKFDLLKEELINLCIKILKFNGFKVEKIT